MKVSAVKANPSITMKTSDKPAMGTIAQWWKAKNDGDLAGQLLSTVAFLKEGQGYRYRQASIFARMYGNQSMFGIAGPSAGRVDQGKELPVDRPTFNLVQSCVDTLVSRISQSRPSPVFLTDNSDYKERNLAKKLNNFTQGEFFRTKTYDKATIMLRDALVEGTGVLKVYRTSDNKVGIDRVLLTELFVDPNEALYGEPRQLFQIKLVDRKVLMEVFTDEKAKIKLAEKAFPDSSADASKTVSDLVMVVEGWHLPSAPGAGDGRHTIACSAGVILDETWEKDKFPFVFLHYSPRLYGFWAQGLAEQLMGTQMEINSLLYTISKAIKLVGVPRVFQEMGSKVVKTNHNNDVGTIVTYSGTKPSYEVAPCVPREMYAQLQRMVDYGYQQSGVSALQATSQKPSGLNSGEAIRSYDDISTDRFNTLSRRYDNVFIDLAYLMIDEVKDIHEDEGEYTTVFTGKSGIQEIDFPDLELLKNPYVIQCFNTSSLPRDPAGRMQKITEMIQAGMITIKEGRRLLDYPDLEQIEKLANASEERIFQILDAVVEDGTPATVDPFMDLQLANDLTVQYYNLYASCKIEEEKLELFRSFFDQIQGMKQAAMPPPTAAPGPTPQAQAQPLPQSPLVPNAIQ